MKFLKNHPFAVEAYFERSLVLTFAAPQDQLARLIPPRLTLDTYHDQWAFIAVALVETKNLRPKGFPAWMGHDFFIIGYRIFVRYTNQAGKRLRGLYIIKSETDQHKMALLGNIFTHYNYTATDISIETTGGIRTIRSQQSQLEISIARNEQEIRIPEGSPFNDWKDARRFAGPLPHTFTYHADDDSVLTIEGVRQNWIPEPVQVKSYSIDYLQSLQLEQLVLANAFEIKNIPYYWKKGELETWQ